MENKTYKAKNKLNNLEELNKSLQFDKVTNINENQWKIEIEDGSSYILFCNSRFDYELNYFSKISKNNFSIGFKSEEDEIEIYRASYRNRNEKDVTYFKKYEDICMWINSLIKLGYIKN